MIIWWWRGYIQYNKMGSNLVSEWVVARGRDRQIWSGERGGHRQGQRDEDSDKMGGVKRNSVMGEREREVGERT